MPKSKTKRTAVRRKAARTTTASARFPKAAVTLIVQLHPREGQSSLLEAALRALIVPTRREDGCLNYELHRSADVPGDLLLHEVWASRDHHRRHTQTPHFLHWNARKDALLASREATFWHHLA